MSNDDELLKSLERGFDRAEKIKIAGLEHDRRCLLAASRIRELTAELGYYKSFHDNVCKAGTHVVVPVEPTKAMIDASYKAGSWSSDIYRAMIKAAKEGD